MSVEFKPYKDMPEASDEEMDKYQEDLINKAIDKIEIEIPNNSSGKIMFLPLSKTGAVVDALKAVEEIKLINALMVNVTSEAWVRGNIDLISELMQIIKTANSLEEAVKRMLYVLQNYADRNKKVLSSLTDNINFVRSKLYIE